MGYTSTPERMEKIAAGIAMIESGSSCLAASNEVGLPESSLRLQYQRWLAGDSATKQRQEDEIIARAVEIVSLAQAEIRTRLVENPQSFKHSDLTAVAGMHIDKIAMHRGWNRTGEQMAITIGQGALEQLFSKLKVSVTVEPAEQAVDVTPKEEP